MKLFTYKTLAEYLDCSPSTVQKLYLAGKIPGFKVGNETRFRQQDIDAWIEGRLHFHKTENPRKGGSRMKQTGEPASIDQARDDRVAVATLPGPDLDALQ